MGISRDSQHKRRLTGGKKPKHHMKQKKKTEGEEAKVEEPKIAEQVGEVKDCEAAGGPRARLQPEQPVRHRPSACRDILAPWPVRPVRRLHPRGEGARVLCQAHGEEEEVGPSPPSVARTVIS